MKTLRICVYPATAPARRCFGAPLSDTQRYTRPVRLGIGRIDCHISTFHLNLCADTHIRSVLYSLYIFYFRAAERPFCILNSELLERICVYPATVPARRCFRALLSDTQRHTRPVRLRIGRIDCHISAFCLTLCADTHIRSVLYSYTFFTSPY